MNDRPTGPDFDPEFWSGVHDRVERVRQLTATELERAAHELLTLQAQAEVVPVFPAPFWARVNKRAGKVREMALDELTDAEERLVNREPAAGAATRRRRAGALRRRPHLPSISVPLRARVNTLGFVTAVLAVLMLLPQVMPITSEAGVRRNPLAGLFAGLTDDDPRSSEPDDAGGESEEGVESRRPGSSSGRDAGKAGPRAESRGTAAASKSSSGSAGQAAEAASGASGGASGQNATGSAGAAAPGESVSGASAEDGASAETRPAAPSNLLVTAVDDRSVRLRWRDNSPDETGFVIERRGDAGGPQTTEANTKTHVWTGLAPSTEACFRVRARNGAGSSDWFPEQYRCVTTHAAQSAPGPVQLTPLACSREGSMFAGANLQETEIRFQNQTGNAVRIYALGREGVRELTPSTLGPQASTTIQTFLGNPYVVTRADESSTCLAIFTGESWSSVAPITEPSG